mmetsp:Transcript_139538/g.446502  ORF Transcript_139538/g.446502 Transcript_139538/m.446502 type:complete len:672 (-) Transcript_139538:100-2115(-)
MADILKVSIAKWSEITDEIVDGPYIPVAITIEPPKGTVRTPSDICIVLDISGSMSDEAKIQGAGGSAQSHGLTLLDIAKHGVKTVAHALGPDDRLSVVLFNHTAETLFKLTKMDEAGQKISDDHLDGVRPGGGTNIWLGLEQGLNVLKADSQPGRFGHIMLLTDGQTTYRATTMENFMKYKQDNEMLPGTVSTFGFGYNIDSELLDQISAFGDATYSFIPDAGFVGTVFVNTLSNLLVTMAREVRVGLDLEDCELVKVLGGHRVQTTSESTFVSLGTFQFEQSRTIILAIKEVKEGSTVGANITYKAIDGKDIECEFVDLKLSEAEPSKAVLAETWRSAYVETVIAAMGISRSDLPKAHSMLQKLGEAIGESAVKDDEKTVALLQDVLGQSSEAVSRPDWYSKWGVHYLPSIKFAHRVQQCNNFKDPSVQIYGGELFKKCQDIADDIFNSLPAPQPSAGRPQPSYGGGGGGGGTSAPAAAAAPVNMAQYNDRYGTCIDSASAVQLADGTRTAIGRLAKGDIVLASGGATAEVLCVVRQPCAGGKANLVQLPGGGRVTPFHPICMEGSWLFPMEISEPQEFECEAVCSIVLQGAPALLVGSEEAPSEELVACAALAHGIEEGAARHAYFGTNKVLEDLRGFPGYDSGLVEVLAGDVVRDVETGLVCRLRPRA